MKRTSMLLALAGLAPVFLSSCGDPVTTESTTSSQQLEVQRDAVSSFTYGVIKRVDGNTVTVDNIDFDITNAEIRQDGDDVSADTLGSGKVVTIRGTTYPKLAAGMADVVTIHPALKGRVEVADLAAKQIQVGGQTISFDANTSFVGLSRRQLETGTPVVEVFAHRAVSGASLRATRIERPSGISILSAAEIEIRGEISALDVDAMTFELAGLIIDYGTAPAEIDVTGGELADGMWVKAESNDPVVDGVLVAVHVEETEPPTPPPTDPGTPPVAALVTIEGVITAFQSPTAFTVNEQLVTTNDDTVFVDGTVDDLALDAELSVAGTLDEGNVLVAEEVVFGAAPPPDATPPDPTPPDPTPPAPAMMEMMITGELGAMDADALTLEVLGLILSTDADTMFVDKVDGEAPVDITFADLAVGDTLKIKASTDGTDILAGKVERRPAMDPPMVMLSGPVDEGIADPTFSIMGVVVETTVDTTFLDMQETPMAAEDFFAALTPGSMVTVDGTMDGAILATQVMVMELAPAPDVPPDTPAPAAADLYVAEGATGGDCSQANPCGTIQDAVALAVAGDVINIGAGIYVENISIGADLDGLTIMGAGVDTTVIVSGTGGDVPKLLPAPVELDVAFDIEAPNVSLSGLTIQHPAIETSRRDVAVLLRESATNALVEGVLMERLRSNENTTPGSRGLLVMLAEGATLRNSEINGYEDNVHIVGNGANIIGNTLSGASRMGITLVHEETLLTSTAAVIEDNIIIGSGSDGIQIQGDNSRVGGNTISESGDYGVHLCGPTSIPLCVGGGATAVASNNVINPNTFSNNGLGDLVDHGSNNILN